MKPSCLNFVNAFVDQSLDLKLAHQKMLDEWMPENPPLTILFGALGDQVIENLSGREEAANRRIFQLVETAMASDDEELRTAVATGLIEAVVTKTDGKEALWQYALSLFGDLSKKHAEWWRGFGS